MSKEKSNLKNGTKQNKPYYLKDISKNNDMVIIDKQITETLEEEKPQKFKISVMKDKNVLISIDGERPHLIYPPQLFAMTLAFINISKIVHPECDFNKIKEGEK